MSLCGKTAEGGSESHPLRQPSLLRFHSQKMIRYFAAGEGRVLTVPGDNVIGLVHLPASSSAQLARVKKSMNRSRPSCPAEMA